MNILIDALPDFVVAGNVKYKVYTDFRIWLEFERVIQLSDISAKDKVMMILKLCLDGEQYKAMPEDVLSITDALKNFYLREKKYKETGTNKQERILDFSEDSGYIYSAFLTQYGIDLLSIPYMHWYVFCSLFEGLEDSRELVKIMRFRTAKPEQEQNPEKRKYLKRMKEFYALADLRSEREKEEDIAKVLLEAF